MSVADQQKWDKKYLAKPQLLRPREASSVLQKYAFQEVGLKALDLASGAGRNTIYLAQQGYSVDAVDIAEIALKSLTKEALERGLQEKIMTHLEDLDHFSVTPQAYALVVMCNFLDRTLIERTKETLKVGGRYIVETYMVSDENEKEDSKSSNLLAEGELKTIFGEGFEILHYDSFENEDYEIYRMKKQVIVAQKL